MARPRSNTVEVRVAAAVLKASKTRARGGFRFSRAWKGVIADGDSLKAIQADPHLETRVPKKPKPKRGTSD